MIAGGRGYGYLIERPPQWASRWSFRSLFPVVQITLIAGGISIYPYTYLGYNGTNTSAGSWGTRSNGLTLIELLICRTTYII